MALAPWTSTVSDGTVQYTGAHKFVNSAIYLLLHYLLWQVVKIYQRFFRNCVNFGSRTQHKHAMSEFELDALRTY